MKKIHVLAVAALLGLAAVLGLIGATRTAGVAAGSTTPAPSVSLAAREHRLAQLERQLARARNDRPPALPAVPASSGAPAPVPRVVYRRPAPVVVVHHLRHGDDGPEHESEAGDD